VLALLLAGCGSPSPEHAVDPRYVRVRSGFGLEPPYTIESNQYFLDGGSSSYHVRGANGRKLAIAWDGGMRANAVGADPFEPEGRPRLLYVGKLRNPRDAVPLRSMRESTLVDLLQLCGEESLTPDIIRRSDSLLRSGDVRGFQALDQTLDPAQRRALSAYNLSLGVRAQQARGYWLASNDPRPDPIGFWKHLGVEPGK